MARKQVHGGTFWEGGRKYVLLLEPELAPAQHQATGRTVDHQPIPEGSVEFLISGLVYVATKSGSRDRRYSDAVSAGQVIESLRMVRSERARHMADLWDRWHLNGMKVNCTHLAAKYGKQFVPGEACPVGYLSGSAWLFEPIPDEALADIRTTFGL